MDRDFYTIVIVPTLQTIKKAMSPAPEGWTVTDETVIDPNPPAAVSGDPGELRVSYSITYKRVAGIEQEKEKLKQVSADLVTRITESARAETDQLAQKKSELGKALIKAQKRKEVGRERKIKNELDAITDRLKAIAGETENKIIRETEPYLVRDTAVTITIALNTNTAEFPQAVPFSRHKAAFALRKEGEHVGPTGWKDGRSMILYGDWQEVRGNTFRADIESKPYWLKPQTIVITADGDRNRIDQLLKKTDLKTIVELMK